MKTIQDYYSDPRLTGDAGLMAGPEEIRIIHAIRLKQQDEMAGMTFGEKMALHQKRTEFVFASLGLPPPHYVDRAGQGKV
jgi:hypothetical protein